MLEVDRLEIHPHRETLERSRFSLVNKIAIGVIARNVSVW